MGILERISYWATEWTGTSAAFCLALLVIVVWAIAGPLVGYSDTWQLIINTLTTLVTFLMVFLIQRSQNKDNLVVQTKLDELLAATHASNRLIDIEAMSEAQVRQLHERYKKLAEQAEQSSDPSKRTSIDE